MVSSKCKVVIVDKKGRYLFLFQGFRKNKFDFSRLETVIEIPSEEIVSYNLFFVVLYEFRDVFELLKLNDIGIPIIVGTENSKIIKKLGMVNYYHCVDLSKKHTIISNLHNYINEIFKI